MVSLIKAALPCPFVSDSLNASHCLYHKHAVSPAVQSFKHSAYFSDSLYFFAHSVLVSKADVS